MGVVSYLMWKNSWSLSETLQYMKKKRKIYPNVGFKFQLQLLDELLALPFEGHSSFGSSSSLDELATRMSLLPSMVEHRLCRLGIEMQDGGLETWQYFRPINLEGARSVQAQCLRCRSCKTFLATEL